MKPKVSGFKFAKSGILLKATRVVGKQIFQKKNRRYSKSSIVRTPN